MSAPGHQRLRNTHSVLPCGSAGTLTATTGGSRCFLMPGARVRGLRSHSCCTTGEAEGGSSGKTFWGQKLVFQQVQRDGFFSDASFLLQGGQREAHRSFIGFISPLGRERAGGYFTLNPSSYPSYLLAVWSSAHLSPTFTSGISLSNLYPRKQVLTSPQTCQNDAVQLHNGRGPHSDGGKCSSGEEDKATDQGSAPAPASHAAGREGDGPKEEGAEMLMY